MPFEGEKFERSSIPPTEEEKGEKEEKAEKEIIPEKKGLESRFIEKESETLDKLSKKLGKAGRWKRALIGISIGAVALTGLWMWEKKKAPPTVRRVPIVERVVREGMPSERLRKELILPKESEEIEKERKEIEKKSSAEREKRLAITFWKAIMKREPKSNIEWMHKIKPGILGEITGLAGYLKAGETKIEGKFIKERFKGGIRRSDIRYALRVLKENLGSFIDYEFGNKDGICSPKEFKKGMKKIGERRAFQYVENLIMQAYLEEVQLEESRKEKKYVIYEYGAPNK